MPVATSWWDKVAAAYGPGYAPRPQQRKMAAAVEAAIAGRKHLVVEAGTGVGKSFGYLVPAIVAAHERGLRAVVSTRTIALQEQLAQKDVPFLLRALGLEERVKVSLAKGRSNYVCRRRVHLARAGGPKLIEADVADQQLEEVFRWSETSVDGSLADLGFRPDSQVWAQVQAERGNCLGKRCRFYDACGWQRARKAMAEAELVIANHSLVFADLKLKMADAPQTPLGRYDVLVFDEAHEVADVATEAFRADISERRVLQVLGRIHPKRDAEKKQTSFGRVAAPPAVAHLVHECRELAALYFVGVEAFRPKFVKDRRIRKPSSFPDPLSPRLVELLEAMGMHRPPKGETEHRLEWAARMKGVEELVEDLQAFQSVDCEHLVFWQEWNRAGKPVLAAAPLEIAPLMRAHLFEKVPTVVCASATLQVGGAFDHFRREVGLDQADALDVGSPFDFARQCELLVYPTLPDPREKAFAAAAIARIRDLVLEDKGGAFLLFTSYQALEEAHTALAGVFRDAGLEVHRHGEASPRDIVESFRRRKDCVLFGTDTFWQGVDVRGDNLRLVVIHKLPFAVPTHPLRQAREEAITKRGGVPFLVLSVPEAVIKVKQGFGRLIRSNEDRGRVAILDSRIRTKGYGAAFLRSLPPCPVRDVR